MTFGRALVLGLLLASCGGRLDVGDIDAGDSRDSEVLVCTPVGVPASCPSGCEPLIGQGLPASPACFDVVATHWTDGSTLVGCYPATGWIGLPAVTCFRDIASGTLYGTHSTYAGLALPPGIEQCSGVPVCLPDAWP